MHTLYKQKKTLLLVTLFCINSLGFFTPAIKASPTENISSRYVPPPLSTLPARIAMITESKKKEYSRIIQYYEYRTHWSSFLSTALVTVVLSIFPIFTIYRIVNTTFSLNALMNINKELLFSVVFLNILFAFYLYQAISIFMEVRHPGAIFLTDTGILFIPSGYNAKHDFIPYQDITTVEPVSYKGGFIIEAVMTMFKIEFAKNFSEYERKGIKYNDNVYSIVIERDCMPNRVLDTNAFQDLYRNVSEITEKIHMEAMREKAKQVSTQEEGKSLLKIKKEQERFIDRFEDISEELHEKTATVLTNHPAIFRQIEAYYPSGIPPFMLLVLMELVFMIMLSLTFYDAFLNVKPLLSEFLFEFAVRLLLTLLLTFGSIIYYLYDPFMHPAGLFIADTGFLYIKAGKKLKYTFIRYKHIEELLRDVNHDTILVRSTQSTHEAGSLVNGAIPQTIKIECHLMKKEIFDALYEHFQLKIAEVKAGKSRLAK